MNYLLHIILSGLLIFSLMSCEKDDIPVPEEENPFVLVEDFNGFTLDTSIYETPNAFIEIWGVTSDGLDSSANFDVTFSDGVYSSFYRQVIHDSIKVYFDINSPSIEDLSPGTYVVDGELARKPNNIVQAYIQFTTYNPNTGVETKVTTYPVLEGSTVEVYESNGYYSVKYNLVTVIDRKRIEVNGQYSGKYTIIDQRVKS